MDLQPVPATVFQRQAAANGVVFYTSPRLGELGVRHLFTSRQGGVSRGPWASLNLGERLGDEPACVAENRRRVRAILGVTEAEFVGVEQVHGGTVAEVLGPGQREWASVQADALVTEVPGVALSVRTADCVPLLLADGRGRAVAAVHGGWRSLAAGIVAHTLERLAQLYGVAPEDCWAALGPAIGPCCFKVGPEVAARFAAYGDGAIHQGPGGRFRIDLAAVASLQLQAAGLPRAQIERWAGCTACQPEDFFSHRRDRGQTGRMVGAIVCPGNSGEVRSVSGKGENWQSCA